ncbi:hypothetical protein APA_3723 [Pseudanabaena sp. lw0831]|nr:hypothetical protein APA_3723 [Pseudanabaena sp. lw0831]
MNLAIADFIYNALFAISLDDDKLRSQFLSIRLNLRSRN